MAEEAVAAGLVDEAPDMTATEAHVRAVARLRSALSYALRGRSAVFAEIFLRVDDREQVAADVFIVPGIATGDRSVYRVPAEPVPSMTLEVLSPANRSRRGRAELEAKRSLFARIGVPLHVEVDPDDGFIAVWERGNGAFVRAELCTTYTSDAIGGVRIETPAPSTLHVVLPNGHLVLDGGDELARADTEFARAETESARAEAESARAEAESARAETESVRAERLAAQLRDMGIEPDL